MERAIRLNPGRPAVYRLVSGPFTTPGGTRSGPLQEAHWEVAKILSINPDFALKSVEVAFPFRDPQDRDRFMADLGKAGFTD